MFRREKKHLFFFLLLALALGFLLGEIFFLLAFYQKNILNLLAFLVLGLLLFRSFWKNRRKSGPLWKKILFIFPNYFHILNLCLFFLVFLPNWLKEPSPTFAIAAAVSFVLVAGFAAKQILRKKERGENTQHG